ncbi:MAG: hypothetical protein ACOYD9_02515 [Pyramidobacter sp.]|jgi:hypothetical protein
MAETSFWQSRAASFSSFFLIIIPRTTKCRRKNYRHFLCLALFTGSFSKSIEARPAEIGAKFFFVNGQKVSTVKASNGSTVSAEKKRDLGILKSADFDKGPFFRQKNF